MSSPRERRDYSLVDAAEVVQRVASSLLDKLDSNPRATTQTERMRARRHLQQIREDALLVAKAAERLLEKIFRSMTLRACIARSLRRLAERIERVRRNGAPPESCRNGALPRRFRNTRCRREVVRNFVARHDGADIATLAAIAVKEGLFSPRTSRGDIERTLERRRHEFLRCQSAIANRRSAISS